MGVDVALITVQVEIVRAIDFASKCYTSHLSTFFFFFLHKTCVSFEKTTVRVNSPAVRLYRCLTSTNHLFKYLNVSLSFIISLYTEIFKSTNFKYTNIHEDGILRYCQLCFSQ